MELFSHWFLKPCVSVSPSFQTDKSGRLKLETVDDLFNILQLRKKRRERKTPIHKKKQPEPEVVVRLVSSFLTFNKTFNHKWEITWDDTKLIISLYFIEGDIWWMLKEMQENIRFVAHLFSNFMQKKGYRFYVFFFSCSQIMWTRSCSWQQPWTTKSLWWRNTWMMEETPMQ